MGSASRDARWTSLRTAVLAAMGLGSSACGSEIVVPPQEQDPVEVDCSNVPADSPGFTVRCEGVDVRWQVGSCAPPTQCNPLSCFDCGPGEECVVVDDGGSCGCAIPCTEDADCGDQTCHCGAGGGHCVDQTCRTSDDCGDDSECAFYASNGSDPCSDEDRVSGYACTTAADHCLPGHGECDDSCRPTANGSFQCQVDEGCEIGGRPFLVEGAARVSSVANDAAWPALGLAASTQLRADDRAALADHWTRIGQLEHASIAAFARFAMQLLSLGAPPDLVRETTSAMNDELHHARLAYGLASAYAGEAIGPGELSMRGALDHSDLDTIVRTLIDEGCIGETIAAHTAKEESERVTDAVVGGVLAHIARDEQQHSLLAWRSLAWLVDVFGEPVRQVLSRQLDRIEQELDETPPTRRDGCGREEQRALARHGLFTSWEVASARRQVLREVVLPVGRALLRHDVHATRAAAARDVSRSRS